MEIFVIVTIDLAGKERYAIINRAPHRAPWFPKNADHVGFFDAFGEFQPIIAHQNFDSTMVSEKFQPPKRPLDFCCWSAMNNGLGSVVNLVVRLSKKTSRQLP